MRIYLLSVFAGFFLLLPMRAQYNAHPLYGISDTLRRGNKAMLLRLATYLESDKAMVLRHCHLRQTLSESEVAQRLLRENLFLPQDEFRLGEPFTYAAFVQYLNRNMYRICFDETLQVYICSGYELHGTAMVPGPLNALHRAGADSIRSRYRQTWENCTEVQTLLAQKDPLCLLKLAELQFCTRSQVLHMHYRDKKVWLAYIELLTVTAFYFGGEEHGSEWEGAPERRSPSDRYSEALLFYMRRHYAEYYFNDAKGLFIRR